MFHYRVKFVEPFKDGSIFPDRITMGTVLVITEGQYTRAVQSGAVLEVIDKLMKRSEEPKQEPVAEVAPEPVVEAAAVEKPKRGRPKKVTTDES